MSMDENEGKINKDPLFCCSRTSWCGRCAMHPKPGPLPSMWMASYFPWMLSHSSSHNPELGGPLQSPVTPVAGDAGALGSDHKNQESSNLRLQISFILQPGRQKPPMVQHLAGDHTGSLGKARERSQVSVE